MPLLSPQDRPGTPTLVLHSRKRERAWLGGTARDVFGERRGPGRLLIVSNRLPFTVRLAEGIPTLVPSSGGLASALRGVHERGGTLWLGWSGVPSGLPSATQEDIDRRFAERGAVGVPLAEHEIGGFYRRYANEGLWPVLHDRPELAQVDPADWATYRAVNARFAEAIACEMRPGDRVWIHDYHLMLVPRLLRERCPDALVGYFLHTPFPTLESLQRLPHRAALLDGLLGADMLGFHTSDDASRFLESVQTTLGRITNAHEVQDGHRRVRVQACPISIDFAAMDSRAADASIVARASALRGRGGALMVGVDRLDYTKGIPERLRAFAELLARQPEYLGKVRLFQLAVPSREEIPAYRALRTEVESIVATINARFGDGHGEWTPVEYVYGTVDAETLAMLYRAADVMVVTPLRDGMNLVAKEFVASRPDDDGVLVLSEQAGASSELRAALLVDPTDVEGLVNVYARALTMSPPERRVRMRRLRRIVRRHDVHQWVRACLLSLGTRQAATVGRTAG